MARVAVPRAAGLLVAGWFILLSVGSYVIAPASLLPIIMPSMGIGKSAGAALVSLPQVSATVLGLPLGMYLDRVKSRVAVLVAGVLIFVGGAWGWAAATDGAFLSLVASRLVGGIGVFILWVVGANVITSAFPESRRATAVAVLITGYPIGYAFGQLTAPLVADRLSWPAVFPVYATIGLAFALLFYLLQGRVALADVETELALPGGTDFRRMFTDRNVLLVALLSFLGYSLYMLYNSWMPTYLTEAFGVSLADSGLFVALFPAVGLLARPVGGWLSDGPLGRRRRPVFFVSFLGAVALAALLAPVGTVPLFVVGLVVAGFFIQMQFGLLYQFVQEFAEPNVAGTAISLVSVTGWLGSFVAPVVVGELISVAGGYTVVFGFAVVVGLAGVVTTWVTVEAR
ncbi:MFS transporter [Halobacteriales archaeon QS_1_68_17]|nr:MAG: MFS transporter [Halobacteriales archaeon QS_1_68_17]